MSLIHDVIKYEAIVEEVIGFVKQAERAKPGEAVKVPAIRTRVAGHLYEWSEHTLTRLD